MFYDKIGRMTRIGNHSVINFQRDIPALRAILTQPGPMGAVIIGQTIDRIAATLPADLEALRSDARFVFVPSEDSDDLARNNAELLRRWHSMETPPSLVALCVMAVETFHLSFSEEEQKRLLVAAILGEVENPLAYHNTLHYKKVLLQLLQLISVHNSIYEGTPRALNPSQIALMMTAACIHDLGHDGKGNTIKGFHEPGRLERRSCATAGYYFAACGCGDEQTMMILRAMIVATDVSPLGDVANPMNQMKSAYRRHYFDTASRATPLNLDPDLKQIERDEALALMALLLHEADIATSAGLDYEVTKFETALYRLEIGDHDPRPQQVIDFLNDVCQRRMLSDAGQQLYAANMARIYALAEQDVRNGNNALPPPEQSGFMMGRISLTDRSGHKTIN